MVHLKQPPQAPMFARVAPAGGARCFQGCENFAFRSPQSKSKAGL